MPKPSHAARRVSRPSVDLPYRLSASGLSTPRVASAGAGLYAGDHDLAPQGGQGSVGLNLFFITRMVQRPGLYLHLFPDGVQARRVIWDGQTVDGIPFLDFFRRRLCSEKMKRRCRVKTIAKDGGMSIYQLGGHG